MRRPGTVTARFPGQDTGGVLDRLERDWGVTVLQDGEDAVFRLAPSVRFEDLGLRVGARSSRCWAEIGSFPSSIPHLTGRAFGDIVRLSNEH